MAALRSTPCCAANQSNRFKEAVCVETKRIFDSCSDKECLEDLHVYFSAAGQRVIDHSSLIKCKSAEVINTYLNVEAVPFNKGYFAVDISFYFKVDFNCYMSPVSTPINVRGFARHEQKVVLFGGDGGVKTFYSNFSSPWESSEPVACLKTADPVVLSSRVVDYTAVCGEPLGHMPEDVLKTFDDEIVSQTDEAVKTVLVTLGLFCIITLQRSAQIMIPMYDYVLPEKGVSLTVSSDDPCEIFKHIRFPVDEFFPGDINEAECPKCDDR